MDFSEAIKIVADILQNTGTTINTNIYDGLIVKRLESSNTLDDGRSSNQTHIAITGSQMDIFPYLRADGYFSENDAALKKYFTPQIPVRLFQSNAQYLDGSTISSGIVFKDGICNTFTSVVRSKRNNQADQIQVSIINIDGQDFVSFRKQLHTGAYFVLLKHKESFRYDAFGVRATDVNESFTALNNQFFKIATQTAINVYSLSTRFLDSAPRVAEGTNILFYGVPGVGKSYKIKTEYCDDDDYMERVVFHPDYSNSDFIGQILPSNINGNISYPFIPGPFTRIMRKAYEHPDSMFYLVIEEINRGNAPAIFGEVFQLLDRVNGESEYGISNADIAGEVYGDPGKKVKIPSNLTILATMNTADQNVFTLDTAFKRRWKMISIPNNFDDCDLSNLIIGGTNLTWREFAESINSIIIDNNKSAMSSEDKRLGAYFVTADEITDAHLFAEKVLAYLWDDVFKYDRSKVFNPGILTLDQLIDSFVSNNIDVFFDDALKFLSIYNNDIKEQTT